MKAVIAAIVIVLLGFFAFTFFNVEQTQEGQLPRISVEGGQLPDFDVDAGSVTVGERETTVTVPDVEVTTEEKTVTVPTLDVRSPEEEQAETEGAPTQDTN